MYIRIIMETMSYESFHTASDRRDMIYNIIQFCNQIISSSQLDMNQVQNVYSLVNYFTDS